MLLRCLYVALASFAVAGCTVGATGDDRFGQSQIAPRAIDNATGTAALGAAHTRAGPTARPQVFLAVTAEEASLLGSDYYGANPVSRWRGPPAG